jgi:hypothetical protein
VEHGIVDMHACGLDLIVAGQGAVHHRHTEQETRPMAAEMLKSNPVM